MGTDYFFKTEYLKSLLLREFHEIDDEPWNDDRIYAIIEIADDNQLHNLVNELIMLLPHSYQKVEAQKRIKENQLKAAV